MWSAGTCYWSGEKPFSVARVLVLGWCLNCDNYGITKHLVVDCFRGSARGAQAPPFSWGTYKIIDISHLMTSLDLYHCNLSA